MKSISLAFCILLAAGLTSCTTSSSSSSYSSSSSSATAQPSASVESRSVKQTLTITIEQPPDEYPDQVELCKITAVLSEQSLDPEQEPIIVSSPSVTALTGEPTVMGVTESEVEKYASTIKLRVGDGYQESIAEGYGIRLIISATPEEDNFRAEGVFFLRTKDREQLIPISGLFPNGEPTIAYERTEHFGANAEAELNKPSYERTHFRENNGIKGEPIESSLFSGVLAPTIDDQPTLP